MEDDPPLVDMWFHLVWVISYLLLIFVSYRLSYIRRPIIYILNKSIECQSIPLSIIEFLHLHAIVLPTSCGSYLGLSFYPRGVVESPKTLTWYQSSHGVNTSSQEVQSWLDSLLVQHWKFGHHNLEEILGSIFCDLLQVKIRAF